MKFKTKVSGSGYQYDYKQTGSRGTLIFEGVECPRCRHCFMPQSITAPPKCPACGFTEDAKMDTLTAKLYFVAFTKYPDGLQQVVAGPFFDISEATNAKHVMGYPMDKSTGAYCVVSSPEMVFTEE
jgi:hypothetical protein